MKAYNYCAISVINSKVCLVFGYGTYSSEAVARQSLAENFFVSNNHYPHEIRISPIPKESLQQMLNDSEGDT